MNETLQDPNSPARSPLPNFGNGASENSEFTPAGIGNFIEPGLIKLARTMNNPAASCGVSTLYLVKPFAASGGEFNPEGLRA